MRSHPELTQHVAKTTAAGVIATGLAGAATIAGMEGLVPIEVLAGWAALQLGCMALRWFSGRSMLRLHEWSPRWETARRRYVLTMAVCGIAWGMASLIAVVYADMQTQLFVLAILLGIVGGAVATVSPVFDAYVGFMGGMMLVQIIAFLIGGERLDMLMGMLTVLYSVVVFTAGRVLSATMLDSLDLREQLGAAKEEAEAASVAKSKFLSSMSHELRTPLNAILGFAQLFEMDHGINEEQRGQAREIWKAGDHLLSLINEMLDLSRIEAGQMHLSMENLALDSVLEECEALARSMAQARGVNLDFRFDAGRFSLRSDRVRLKQVLLNLLSNAIKYNQPQGQVTLSCREVPAGSVRILVQDTGPGIPSALQPHLFEAFNRLGKESGLQEGTGIGLVITRELVELMGGSIGFDSVEGQGSTFWVEFPLAGTES